MNKKLEATIQYIIDVKRVKDVTPKKLQKLLYYVQAWHLALTAENDSVEEIENALLFPVHFEAWVHGPVIPEVYTKYKEYGSDAICNSDMCIDYSSVLSRDELSTINEVVKIYGDFDGNQLESLTHNELPWKEARKGLAPLESSHEFISNETMFKYYANQLV